MDSATTDPRSRLCELRAEMANATEHSRENLHGALKSAWRMGQLLRAEKANVRRRMGRSAWPTWLAANFPDSQKTAARLMKLARISDEQTLRALSLRQAYFRLGIPTEPKRRATTPRLALPNHIRSAQRLLLAVRMRLRLRQMSPAERSRLCTDLAPLHRQLNALFLANENRPHSR